MYPEQILVWRWFLWSDYLVLYWLCEHGRPHLVVIDMYPAHVKIRSRPSWGWRR